MTKEGKNNNFYETFKSCFLLNIFRKFFSMGYILLQAWFFSNMVSYAMQYQYNLVIQCSVYLVILTSIYFGANILLKNKIDMLNEISYQVFREKIVRLFFMQPRKKVWQFSPGEIRKNIDLDAKKVADYHCIVLPIMISNSLFVLVTLYLFVKQSIILGAIFIIMSAIQVIPHILVSFFSYKYYDADREAQAKWTENIMSMYFGNATIKLYALHKLFFNKFRSLNEKWDKLGRKASTAGRISEGISSLIESLLQVFSYLILGYFLLQGELDFAEVTYLLVLAPKLFSYTNSVFSVFPQMVEYIKAKKNITEWEIDTHIKNINTLCSQIVVDSVSIKYGEKDVLKKFSCKIDFSKKYYIVGENGSGKTSLLECIVGIRTIENGKILYDSYDIKQLNDHVFYNQFIYLSQEDAALDMKAYDLFGEACCNVRDRALKIAKQFGLENNSIYSTSISDLSGGERKKVYLSFALANEDKFLFLDEPTNCLDLKSVELLLQMLKERKKGSLIITHDMKMLENKNGEIVYSL